MTLDRSWRQRYAAKVCSARDAMTHLRPHTRLFIASGAAEPTSLVEALVSDAGHLAGNEIVHLLTLGPAPYVAPGLQERFRHKAFFIGANVRDAVAEGRADFMPVFLFEIPSLIRSGACRVDAALISVSQPDVHGTVSLGVSVDIVRAAVDTAGVIIAEVNEQMPRTHGDTILHVRDLAALIPVNRPLPEATPEPLDEVCRAIGRNVAALIPHGATLQMGIGRIPDATLAALDDHIDLGVHTEMCSDGVMRLALAGVINGRRKAFGAGKIVTSFVIGSAAMYEWVHDNPLLEFRPTEYTNDPMRIARLDQMVAINAAVAVDLTGQVAADTVRGRFFSGIGGQVDFIRGAGRARDGVPVIALPATAKDGTVSRIQGAFEEGTGVVTSRGDVHWVVTEFGAVNLWGKTIRERAEALISIAHPDFRGELRAAAVRRRYLFGAAPPPAA